VLAAQAIGIVIVHGPVPEKSPEVSAATVQVPEVTEVFVVVGAVQPAGTTTVASEPVRKDPSAGAVKLKTNWLPVEAAITDVGATVIVPSPLAAEPVVVKLCGKLVA